MMDGVLEWVEKAALENLRGHIQSADTLAKEAVATLAILMAMLSGAFVYAIKVPNALLGALVLTIYLFTLCVILVCFCLRIKEIPAATNEPKNLMQEGYALDALRKVELRNMQERIDQAAKRNAITTLWLNRVRIAAVCSPIVYVIATFVAAQGSRVATVAAAG